MMICRLLVIVLLGFASTTSMAQRAVPPLSVKTLFHPKDKFDFDGPNLPEAKWSSTADRFELVIQRGKQWMVHDRQTGAERAWEPTVDKVGELRRIDDGLAIVRDEDQPEWITRDARAWRHPTLSPDGQQVAFVEANDLYIVNIQDGQRRRITSDESDTILNGILDWSYQEEIYGRGNFKAIWWSPDSRQLAFLRLDITAVYPFTLADSRTPRGGTLTTRYPKVGDPIPAAQLWVTDNDGRLTPIFQPAEDEREQLIVRVGWHPGGQHVIYQVMNRLQNWLEVRQSPPVTATGGPAAEHGERVLTRDESTTWVEVLGEPHWLPDGQFLWLSDQPVGRRRVWRISADGRLRVAVTPSDMDVRSIEFVSPDGQLMFVTGDRQRGTVGQQIYRVDLTADSRQPDGLTTAMQAVTTEPGWHEVDVSPDGKWLLDRFSRLEQPPELRLLEIVGSQPADASGDGAEVPPSIEVRKRVLVAAAKIETPLLPVQWLTITTADGVPLPAYLIRPAASSQQAGPSGRTPVLIETYGGPQAPSAVDRWSGPRHLYRQMLAQQGIAVLVTDNRSSAGRGIADTWKTHRRMGVIELADTLVAVDWLKQQPWVKADAIAMRGWSFGGFLTAYALTHSDAFAAGVAGGSPTDWRNYDAIYTERYMGSPIDNKAGYDETSVNLAAKELHGALLLIHGEMDDNVHPANTLQLARELQRAGKRFDMMVYPGSAHGVKDADQVYHMMQMVTAFLHEHLR